ncbi:hypothetical protein BDF21DRAFT_352281, partial [Thamnidium elegans]
LHSQIIEPNVEDDSILRNLQSQILRSSKTAGAYLLDISHVKSKYTDEQSMLLVRQQHPNTHACLALTDDGRRYLEICIDDDQDDNDPANNGLTFPECNLLWNPSYKIVRIQKIRIKSKKN